LQVCEAVWQITIKLLFCENRQFNNCFSFAVFLGPSRKIQLLFFISGKLAAIFSRKWTQQHMSRILFVANYHCHMLICTSRPLFVGWVICRSRGGLSANEKEEKIASDDLNNSYCHQWDTSLKTTVQYALATII